MMRQVIGIDFGTTNSLISVVIGDVASPYLDGNVPYPSIVAYDAGHPVVGREAKKRLEGTGDTAGNIIRAPKRLLGKGIQHIDGYEKTPSEIVRDVMLFLKESALKTSDQEKIEHSDFSKAVVSIPVAMDGRARQELRDGLMQAGIDIVQFVHEPLAALYGYFRERHLLDEAIAQYHDRLVLVFDWGGGTLDLTLCHVLGQQLIQVANIGDNEVGGDYVDEALSDFILSKELQKRGMDSDSNIIIQAGARSRLLEEAEKAKIALSSKAETDVYIYDFFEFDDDTDPDIEVVISREELDSVSSKYINRGFDCIDNVLKKLNIDQRRISLCLATGGMVQMPSIRDRLLQKFSIDRVRISEKGDRIISEGCAWIAADEANLTLAKDVEVREARNSYVPIYREGTHLPRLNQNSLPEPLDLYCSDPRDGKAKVQLCRPEKANFRSRHDPRITYDSFILDVDRNLKPLEERITLHAVIDHDLILKTTAVSGISKKKASCEIFDLEFGLALPGKFEGRDVETSNDFSSGIVIDDLDAVVARSNVCQRKDKSKIPGELLHQIEPRSFDPENGHATKEQDDEKHRYTPCSKCKRYWNHPDCHCDS